MALYTRVSSTRTILVLLMTQQNPADDTSTLSALQKRVKLIVAQPHLLDGLSTDELDYLSSIMGESFSVIGSRRGLRSVLNGEAIRLHTTFVDEYEKKVVTVLESELSLVERLEEDIAEAIDRVAISRERLGACLEKSDSSQKAIDVVEKKLVTVKSCFELFAVDRDVAEKILSESLNPSTGGLNPVLLDFVDSIEQKRMRCQILMDSVANSQLAQDCLSESVDVQELFLEKLFLLVQVFLPSIQPAANSGCITRLIFLRSLAACPAVHKSRWVCSASQ